MYHVTDKIMKAKMLMTTLSILGLAAGMYSGLTYGLKEARGTHDWVMFLSFHFIFSWAWRCFFITEDAQTEGSVGSLRMKVVIEWVFVMLISSLLKPEKCTV